MSSFAPPPPPPGPNYLAMLAGIGAKPHHFVLITFHYPPQVSELEASHYIQPIVNTADDWIKYSSNCWIVWTSKTAHEWYLQFQGVDALKPCSILAVGVDLSANNRSGQLPKWVWEWIDKPRR